MNKLSKLPPSNSLNFTETILSNCFTPIHWMPRPRTENHSGSCQKDPQLQLKKLIPITNFTGHSSLHTQSYFVKSSMWSIQRISEKKKRKWRFANKQPKFKLNHLFRTINWLNKWLKKLIRMKLAKNKLTRWRSLNLQRLKKKKNKKSK